MPTSTATGNLGAKLGKMLLGRGGSTYNLPDPHADTRI